MREDNNIKIIFLNQMAGPLFRELAEDLSKVWCPSLLYTGHPHTAYLAGNDCLLIEAAPAYDRGSIPGRFLSWIRYFLKAIIIVLKQRQKPVLFIVSNPPFSGLIGLFFKIIRNQRYMVLIYDIYPDVLISIGRLKKGFVADAWNSFNRLILKHASLVITIGHDMACQIEKKLGFQGEHPEKVIVIPPWADVDIIKPIPKSENWFAKKYGLTDKITVLYSGNMGKTHDIESILEVAKELKAHKKLHFLLIGEGEKWTLAEETIKRSALENVTLLPFQSEDTLPYSFTTGDIGVVAYLPGTEGYMIPSKTYYYMAAGLALLVTCNKKNDLSEMVAEKHCGVSVGSGEIDKMKQAILAISADSGLLNKFKKASRNLAEESYSRKNTKEFEKNLSVFMKSR
jgi:glycosyltransferase involved in cell wall biosynthesis